jgi:hypothetical protein
MNTRKTTARHRATSLGGCWSCVMLANCCLKDFGDYCAEETAIEVNVAEDQSQLAYTYMGTLLPH